MHHREHEDSVLFNAVKNAKRKTVYETAPNILFDDGPGMGVVDDVLYGSKYLGREIVAQTGFAVFVVINRRLELFVRFGMK